MITTILLLLPLFSAIMIFFMKDERMIRITALAASVMMFIVAVYGAWSMSGACVCDWLINIPWISNLGINLRFGMDGISLMMVLLTTFVTPLVIGWASQNSHPHPALFFGLIMLMEMAFIGVFTAFNGIIFYIFWEMALIPAYFIAALWGGNDRIRITFRFFIFTFAGSLFMLASLIFLFYHTPTPHSFDLLNLYMNNLTPDQQKWVFMGFFLAFAVKIPVFPLHSWQPDTYTESPSEGTMLLSGIMLKMGTYGLLRFLMPVTPDATKYFALPVMILAVTGIIYASVIAIRQSDMKRLFAWSSMAHVGLIAAAAFALNIRAMGGSVLQMVTHGVNITGLFMIAAMLERRLGTREISSMGGIAGKAPVLATTFMIIILGSIGLPLTNGFVGEFLMLSGLFSYNIAISAVAGVSIILSAVYMLRMYQRSMLGESKIDQISDLTFKEILLLAPVILLIIWIGVYPGFFLDYINPAVAEMINIIK